MQIGEFLHFREPSGMLRFWFSSPGWNQVATVNVPAVECVRALLWAVLSFCSSRNRETLETP
jgi:hypothetical protein